MSNKTEFERQLLALDREKLYAFLALVIKEYLDYEQTYPALDKVACNSAIGEMMVNVEGVVNPYDDEDE